MPTQMKTYGLLIERRFYHGSEYVTARVVRRENDHPLGCSSDGERGYDGDVPKHMAGLHLDGLESRGFISDFNGGSFIGHEVEYRDVYSADLPKIKRMAKTLQRVVSRKQKDRAYDAGDALVSFAKALKLSFVVQQAGRSKGRDYADSDWNFMTIEEGRNAYRYLIEEVRKDMRERAKVVA